jgi:hypothetical protein
MKPVSGGLTRRRLVATSAWTVPVAAVSVAAPAYAASCAPQVTFVTTGLASGGYDLRLRDSKNQNSNSNTDPFNNANAILNPVVNLTFKVTDCAGTAVSGATVVVQSDHQRDGEPPSAGGELLGFTPGSQQSGFGEQAGNRVATVTTAADGTARVKICTATYSVEDNGAIPRSGTWTMAVTINGVTTTFTYTYQVIDGLPLAG